MAEFGENIRKAREKLGITQQTLADKLYVTRQAVSRWENGSRYPDLLTAKKLSQALDTTLDELLADDDMHTYPEVNPVIEYPLYKRVQTALFSAAFITNLVQLLWGIFYIVTENPLLQGGYVPAEIVAIATSFLITADMLYGTIKSIKDAVDPRVAVQIATAVVGIDILNQLSIEFVNWQNQMFTLNNLINMLIHIGISAGFIMAVLLFFLSEKARRPIAVYLFAGVEIVMFTISYAYSLFGIVGSSYLSMFMMTTTLRFFAVLLIPALIVYMTAVLHRKRRLSNS